MEVNGDGGDGPLSARELGQSPARELATVATATPPPSTAVPSRTEPNNRRPTETSSPGSISTGLFQADRQWEAAEMRAESSRNTFFCALMHRPWRVVRLRRDAQNTGRL